MKHLIATFSLVLPLFCGQPALAGDMPEIVGAQSEAEKSDILRLTESFNNWIASNTELAPNPSPVRSIRFVEAGDLIISGGEEHWIRQRNRGLYGQEDAVIYLRRPWDVRNIEDQSVLLHELYHHAQVDSRHWYCHQAMEWDAYRAQERWLAANGTESGFNWTAILLESSCAPRDHHPD